MFQHRNSPFEKAACVETQNSVLANGGMYMPFNVQSQFIKQPETIGGIEPGSGKNVNIGNRKEAYCLKYFYLVPIR